MITLYQYAAVWGLPNGSPFCQKVEAFLRFNKLEYKVRYFDPRKAPKKKLPFIEDDGERIADSQFILEHLVKKHSLKIDAHLSAQEKATGQLIERALEDSLYWQGIYTRWVGDDNFAITNKAFFGHLKGLAGLIVPALVRKTMRTRLHHVGTLMHTHEEINHMASISIVAMNDYLGDKKYLLGDQVSSYDASFWSFATAMLCTPHQSQAKSQALKHETLKSYCLRIRDEYFEDFPQMGFH